MGVDPNRMFFIKDQFNYQAPIDRIAKAVEQVEPVLLVIDTLGTTARSIIGDQNKGDDWPKYFLPLLDLIHGSKVGCLLLAHAKKDSSEYRGSTAIGAYPDQIFNMKTDKRDDTIRHLASIGRITMEDFAIRLVGNEYRLIGGEDSLLTRVLRFIHEQAGVSKNKIVDGVGGNRASVLAAVDRLEAEGRIVNCGMATGTSYWAAPTEEATDAN